MGEKDDSWENWRDRLSVGDTITVIRHAKNEEITRKGTLTRLNEVLYLGLNAIPNLITGGYDLVEHKVKKPPEYGEFARAKCGAPGLSLGVIEDKTYVLFVSAQDNDLALDEWDPDGDTTDARLPTPLLTELRGARAAMLYCPLRYISRRKEAVSVTNGGYPGGVANANRGTI